MNTLTIILIFISSILYLIARSKNKKLNLKVQGIIAELKKPIRSGHYTEKLEWTNTLDPTDKKDINVIVFVNELDRFKNGESKLEIDKIECGISYSRISIENVEKFIRGHFVSIKKTSDITWLESEPDIKEMRKHKLEQLKESIK